MHALQSIEHLRYYAGWADKIHGMTIPTGGPVQAITYREPLGMPHKQSMRTAVSSARLHSMLSCKREDPNVSPAAGTNG